MIQSIEDIRNKLISALQFDLSGQSGDVDMLISTLSNEEISELWEKNKGMIDQEKRTEEYLKEQMVELSYNFSKERFEFCKDLAKELFPVEEYVKDEIDNSDSGDVEKKKRPLLILLVIMIVLAGVTIVIFQESSPPMTKKSTTKNP